MRKALGLVGATLLFAGPALAADLGRPAPVYKAPPPPVVFSWTGFYIGAHGGYGWATNDGLDMKGGFGGGQVGYNYQINNFVLGLEGDFAGADISQSVSGIDPTTGAPVSAKVSFNSLASARGRLGIAFGNALIYGTGGGGWADVKASISSPLFGTLSGSKWESGWTAGAGIEYAIQPNWSVKLEYLRYGIDVESVKVDIDTIKAGINYRF